MQKQKYWLACLVLAAAVLAQGWQAGPQTGFTYWRLDGEYFPGTGKVYFLGGRLSDGNTDGSIWSFDPVGQTYVDVGVDLPKPISNYDITLLRDDYDLAAGDTYGLYIVGGRLSVSPNNGTDTVQVYYPVSNRARVLPTDAWPGRVGGVPPVGHACVAYGNKMYVYGGFNSTTWAVTTATWLFDPLAPSGSRWTQLRNMNKGRTYRLCATVDSFIYAIAGDTAYSSALYARAECERMNALDTATGWTSIPSLPVVAGEARAFGFDGNSPYGFGGQIITAGRGIWPDESTNCYIYNTATSAWDTFPRLRQARRNHAGAFIPGSRGSNGIPGIWVWGGRQIDDQTILRTSEYVQMNLVGAAERRGLETPRLVVSPNPARGAATVRFAPAGGGPVRLKVYDVLGSPVYSATSGEGLFIVKGLAAGTYVLRLEARGGNEERKLVIAR